MNQQGLDSIFLSKTYSKLIECATSGETITTEQLADAAGLPKSSQRTVQNVMNRYLSQITDFEYEHGRPMLTALIVQKSNKPTKAWLKTYFLVRNGESPEQAESLAKSYLTAERSEDCKHLLTTEQNRVVEYWTIPQQS